MKQTENLKFPKNLLDYYIELASLYMWRNRIPNKIIYGRRQKYKCRKNWFHCSFSVLSYGIALRYIDDPEIISSYKQYTRHIDKSGLVKRLTITDDINRMDEIILKALKHIKRKLTIANKIRILYLLSTIGVCLKNWTKTTPQKEVL